MDGCIPPLPLLRTTVLRCGARRCVEMQPPYNDSRYVAALSGQVSLKMRMAAGRADAILGAGGDDGAIAYSMRTLVSTTGSLFASTGSHGCRKNPTDSACVVRTTSPPLLPCTSDMHDGRQ